MRESVEERQAVQPLRLARLPSGSLLLWAVWPFIGLFVEPPRRRLPFPHAPSILNILAIPLLIFLARASASCSRTSRPCSLLRPLLRHPPQRQLLLGQPFYQRTRISLRAHNLNTPTLKVNSRAGNPVEVAAVVVWRNLGRRTRRLRCRDYGTYIVIQAESAVRAVVSARWYDGDEHGGNSLRGDMDAVAELLATTIQEHVALAGLEVVEARIRTSPTRPRSPAPCCAGQQAEAVVAARAHRRWRRRHGQTGHRTTGSGRRRAALGRRSRATGHQPDDGARLGERDAPSPLGRQGLAWPYWRALPCSAAHCSPGRWPGPPVSSRRRWCSREAEIQGLAGQAKPQQISYGGLITVALNEPPRISRSTARRTGRHRDQPRCRRAGQPATTHHSH